ncbi:NTF2-related export protein 1-like isoform X2 [Anneissia japonica]|uniref:NTF2-related export protein 1-like isoform X2 n=1 Tax=Anneissia japonica TaxID=1529436 RepID=UPI0014254F5F|nr:NTF2-related export protein 1-like isoform X2 [Anneissia japonica]
MAAVSSVTFKAAADSACQAGEAFHKIYFETFDKKRNKIDTLYHDTSTMVWNGHPVRGSKEITAFLEHLPTSETTLENLMCQPVIDTFTEGQTTVLVTIFGHIKFNGHKEKPFTANFTLARPVQSKVFKIFSNYFRYQE